MDHHDEEFLRRAAEAKARIPQVSPATVEEKAASGAVVIDVREPGEHETSHVAGSVNISIGVIAEKALITIPNKDTPLICYCNSGNRGALAAVELQKLGYTNVSSIAGGLKAYVSFKNEPQ